MKTKIMRFAFLQFLLFFCVLTISAESYPAWCSSTTNLNIRTTPSKRGGKISTVTPGTWLQVRYVRSDGWAVIEYNNGTAYCYAKYLSYREPVRQQESQPVTSSSSSRSSSSSGWDFLGIIFYIIVTYIALAILRYVLLVVLGFLSKAFYYGYVFVSFPFYFLNWMQRLLAKPWFLFYKNNTRSDARNEELREIYGYVKIPLYVILTPLRFVNAVYYNMVVHCFFEMINYLIEVVVPSNDKEGGDDNFALWTLFLPWRIVKYPVWHGALTVVESAIWTVIDTFVPALTLFHGTSPGAAESITQGPGRVCSKDWYSGVWNVGTGNYAGNGIYFAPKRGTAEHYSSGSLIVCRVSLGKTLDLGMAPRHVYDLCGKPNALGVTNWGLKNGYVTGEWWRGDLRARWWEYCMYDWQNRYNDSWRIRPLYVISINEESIQRIPGGMIHWLFNKMVICDIGRYLEKQLG